MKYYRSQELVQVISHSGLVRSNILSIVINIVGKCMHVDGHILVITLRLRHLETEPLNQ